MLAAFKNIQEKIDARIMRERILILFSVFAIIFMLWNFVIQAPFDKKIKETQLQLDAVAVQRTTMQTQISSITASLLNDPDKQKKAQIEQLQADIASLDTQLQAISQSLIKADKLPVALQDVLQKTSQLTLMQVNTLPAHELQLTQTSAKSAPVMKDSQSKDTTEESAGVYEHAVELKVSGNYLQVVQFLIALEQLPWRFYWQSLDYKVTQYPSAEITLRVYTLSAEEGLLGV